MHRPNTTFTFALMFFLCATIGQTKLTVSSPQGVLSEVPEKVDAQAHYLFYLHGRIVEDRGIRPTHERHGVYEYEQIVDTFKQAGFVVISEVRRKDTDMEQYAAIVAEQVRRLLKAGVPPKRITVVGASKGAGITIRASRDLKNRNIKFVTMGPCAADFLQPMNVHGNLLSIYERSDVGRVCPTVRADARKVGKYKELELNTGLGHGFLYKPMKEWVEPVLTWARE
jgi:hypothetical protein